MRKSSSGSETKSPSSMQQLTYPHPHPLLPHPVAMSRHLRASRGGSCAVAGRRRQPPPVLHATGSTEIGQGGDGHHANHHQTCL